jgi:hypothetical protein
MATILSGTEPIASQIDAARYFFHKYESNSPLSFKGNFRLSSPRTGPPQGNQRQDIQTPTT